MTPIGPVPFVGRQNELIELKEHLAIVSLVSLHGALGSGKTRLVTELAPGLGAPCTLIECHPGDRASALRSRAERALRCVPGTLAIHSPFDIWRLRFLVLTSLTSAVVGALPILTCCGPSRS
jgi:hypothetical protein